MNSRKIYNIFTPEHTTIPIGLYIIRNNKPYELHHNVINNIVYIIINNNDMLEYREHLDGIPLDKEEVSRLYPEYFI